MNTPVQIHDDLLARLRMIADVLGGRRLPLGVIIEALLVEAAEDLEASARVLTATEH